MTVFAVLSHIVRVYRDVWEPDHIVSVRHLKSEISNSPGACCSRPARTIANSPA